MLLLNENDNVSQRQIAEMLDVSLGTVNKCIKSLRADRFLNENMQLTSKAKKLIQLSKPKNAIILAAGFGMRMVPINTSIPKALLEVDGEKLIEKIIQYLHKVNIYEVHIVVGFMKERFDYLVAQYGVKLIENKEYATKNNLHSLALASEHLENAYIIPCDIWCNKNPFHTHELYSWYMVSDLIDDDSTVRINRRMELEKVGILSIFVVASLPFVWLPLSYFCGQALSNFVVRALPICGLEEKIGLYRFSPLLLQFECISFV